MPQLFTDQFFHYKEGVFQQIDREVNAEDKTYLLNVNPEEYIEHLVQKHMLESVDVDLDSIQVVDTPEKHSRINDPIWGPTTRKHLQYIFELDYTGNSNTFRLQPGTSRVWRFEADFVAGNKIRFTIDDYSGNPEQVKTDLTGVKNNLLFNVAELKKDIAGFNAELRNAVTNSLNNRKAEIEKYNQNLVEIGVPFKKKEQIPATFAVPLENRQKQVSIENTAPKPKQPADKPQLPDPTLAESIYQDILTTTHDVGKVMERLPKLYSERDENSLRDLFLLYLEPRYTSAGGETFNGEGKTDILIRYKNSNVFIAEFKFWEGQKQFSEAIEQLFGYLTWRDSKAALIIFNKNKDHSGVVSEIQNLVANHSCFVKQDETIEDTWLNYILHFPGDEAKHIRLAIQIFHLK